MLRLACPVHAGPRLPLISVRHAAAVLVRPGGHAALGFPASQASELWRGSTPGRHDRPCSASPRKEIVRDAFTPR